MQVIEEAQPDLRPTPILFTPSQVVPGAVVRFDSGVRTDGTAASPDFNIRWLVDGQDVGATGRHIGVPARSPIKDNNSEFSWTVLPGRHTIAFLLDFDFQVPETNEINNRTTVPVGDGPVTAIDLAATGRSSSRRDKESGPAPCRAGSIELQRGQRFRAKSSEKVVAAAFSKEPASGRDLG